MVKPELGLDLHYCFLPLVSASGKALDSIVSFKQNRTMHQSPFNVCVSRHAIQKCMQKSKYSTTRFNNLEERYWEAAEHKGEGGLFGECKVRVNIWRTNWRSANSAFYSKGRTWGIAEAGIRVIQKIPKERRENEQTRIFTMERGSYEPPEAQRKNQFQLCGKQISGLRRNAVVTTL